MVLNNQKGFRLVEGLLAIVIMVVLAFIAFYFARNYIENTKRDSMTDSAYFFIDDVRKQLTAENALPDLEKALIISYEDFKDNLKKGGKSPFDGKEYDAASTYVAIINNDGMMEFYIAMKDQSGHCLPLLKEDDVKVGSKKLRSYVKKDNQCQITPLDSSTPITSLLYKNGDEAPVNHNFVIY